MARPTGVLTTVRFQFVVALRGKPPVETFFKYGLRSLMTTGNLLAFAGDETLLDFYGTEAAQRIAGTDLALRIGGEILGARWTMLPAADGISAAAYEQAALQLAVRRPGEPPSAIVLLSPGAVYADGTLATVRSALLAGARAVVIPTVDTTIGFLQELRAEYNPRSYAAAACDAREMANLWHHYHAPVARYASFGSVPYAGEPDRVLFPAGASGTVVYDFDVRPLAVVPHDRNVPDDVRWGLEFAATCAEPGGWAVVQDSARALAVRADYDPDWAVATARSGADHATFLAAYLRRRASPLQRRFAAIPFTIRRTANDDDFAATIARAQPIVDALTARAQSDEPLDAAPISATRRPHAVRGEYTPA